MTQSTRIILNTLATYGRSLVALCLGLWTSRWVLAALGQTDFGLFGVVGSLMIFVQFFSIVFSGSITRYYAYSIGQGHHMSPSQATEDLQKWFQVACLLHFSLAFLVVCAGYPIGLYAINHWLNIPLARLSACIWVFRLSLVSAFVSIVSVPYISMYTARQLISELAFFDLARVISMFGCSYWLMTASGDRLIIYAGMMAVIPALINVSQIIRAHHSFPACHLKSWGHLEMQRLRKIGAFALWRFLGVGGWLCQAQGSAFLVNLKFGPIGNASYSVANQLSAQTYSISNALINAFMPAVTSVAGEKDAKRFQLYTLSSCKFTGLLASFVAAPLIVEAHSLFQFWLKTPPPLAAELCLFLIIAYWLNSLSAGYEVALNANGKIGSWQTVEAIILALTLPFLLLSWWLGGGYEFVGIIFLLTIVMRDGARLIFAKKLLDISYKIWFKNVLSPCGLIFLLCLCGSFMIRSILSESILRLICVGICSTVLWGVLAWRIALNSHEKEAVIKNYQKIKKRFFPNTDI